MPDYSTDEYPQKSVKTPQAISNENTAGPTPALPKAPRAISNENTSGSYPPTPQNASALEAQATRNGAKGLALESNPKMGGLIQFAQEKMIGNGPFFAGKDVDLSDYPDYGNFTPNELEAAKAAARAVTQGTVNSLSAQGVMPKYDMYANSGAAPSQSPAPSGKQIATKALAGAINPSGQAQPTGALMAKMNEIPEQQPQTGALMAKMNEVPSDLVEKAKSLSPVDWKGFFKLAGDILDAAGVSASAAGGVNRQTRLQQAFANNLMIEQQKQKAMNEAKATITTLEPAAQARIEQIRAEYEASGNKDVYVSKLNQARNLALIDEQQYTNLLKAAVSPSAMLGRGRTAAVEDLTGPGGVKRE